MVKVTFSTTINCSKRYAFTNITVLSLDIYTFFKFVSFITFFDLLTEDKFTFDSLVYRRNNGVIRYKCWKELFWMLRDTFNIVTLCLWKFLKWVWSEPWLNLAKFYRNRNIRNTFYLKNIFWYKIRVYFNVVDKARVEL
jgi:hypothetical protein